MTPVLAMGAALTRLPVVATFHASGDLAWAGPGCGLGLPARPIDARIAVSERARATAERPCAGQVRGGPERRIDPAGRRIPSGREHRILFVGRHEARKGLPVLLRAWPDIHRLTGARLRVIGADPLAVRLLLRGMWIPDEGIDVPGFLSQEDLTAELLSAAMAAPSLGGESFGMVRRVPRLRDARCRLGHEAAVT